MPLLLKFTTALQNVLLKQCIATLKIITNKYCVD